MCSYNNIKNYRNHFMYRENYIPKNFNCFDNLESFLQAYPNTTSRCKTPTCVDLNKQLLKHILVRFFKEAENKEAPLRLNLNPKYIQLALNFPLNFPEDRFRQFRLDCVKTHTANTNQSFVNCEGFLEKERVYTLAENSLGWEECESLTGSEPCHGFLKDNVTSSRIEALIKTLNSQIDMTTIRELPAIDSIEQCPTLNLGVPPAQIALVSLGAIGIGYCIYKVSAIVAQCLRKLKASNHSYNKKISLISLSLWKTPLNTLSMAKKYALSS